MIDTPEGFALILNSFVVLGVVFFVAIVAYVYVAMQSRSNDDKRHRGP